MSSVPVKKNLLKEWKKGVGTLHGLIVKSISLSKTIMVIESVTVTLTGKKDAERKAKEATKTLEKRSFLYMGLLAFTLLCVGIMNNQVASDFIDFFKIPAFGIYEASSDYIDWFISLSDKMDIAWAWVVRILLTFLIISIIVGIGIGISAIAKCYKTRWCTLSLKIMVVTLAIITVFGEPIRGAVSINLILLFILIQIAYLFVLWYFDGYFENRYRSDEWKKIQNR